MAEAPKPTRLRRLPARLRFGLLCGALTVAGVVLAVLPVAGEAQRREAALQREGLLRTAGASALALDGSTREDGLDAARLAALGVWAGDGPAEVTVDPSAAVDEALVIAALDDCRGARARSGVWVLGDRPPEAPRWAFACARLPSAPDRVVAAAIPAQAASRAATSRRGLLLALGLGALAGALILAVIRRLLAPLDLVSEAARRLARGERGVRVEGLEEPDLRPLADAIDQLADAVEQREDAILGRLELTRELAGLVAHEVRNPLQTLTVLADEACYEPDPDARRELLREIQRELGGIEEVVRRLLDSGEALRLVRREASLRALLERCVRLQGPEARAKSVSLDLQIDAPAADPLSAQVDPALVRRAVENLIRNAVAMVPVGGRVVAEVAPAPGGFTIRIDDDGPGVPAGERERIFERGVTGRPGGTGLGLPLARMVAAAHGGRLVCEDAPDGGARFTMWLPGTLDDALPDHRVDAPAGDPQ